MNFKGKTILVTRPQEQAEKTIREFEAQGASVLHIPFIEITDPSDHYATLDEALASLFQYHWILFTSGNAVARFFSRPHAPCGKDLSSRVAAVGPETAKLLHDLDVHDMIIAETPSAEGLLEILRNYSFEGKRVLFPRAKEGRDMLVQGLEKRGAIVDVVETYQTIFPKDFDHEQFIHLMDEGKLDVVHFASPSAVKHFMQMILERGLQEKMCRLQFLAIGSTTETTLRNYGIESLENIEK
ncbi:MAG: hypothetical protein A3I05_07755 [Deltaproteobacteria bacterium RIFCSPLOWO2_02_FULL_44_10]|nr:MAG: hypothetical protein A3C46_09470 [Deltaproteobacteria bacterium RIFCSPHIGHO2_02_FULL_44_16]OGQ46774.1 MAG: hypothetical protein A3I05_07755 [Deltaproteobacteria bacterium RIFCSPLOWO2_02_FULL_44_10]